MLRMAYSAGMQFLADIHSGSFVHRMGRARNRENVKVGGITFHWDGTRHCYTAGLRRDLPEGLLNHPAVRVAMMSNPPAVLVPEEEMWKPDPAPKRGPGRPKKTELVATPPEEA
jgi:hypothetical protein